MVSITIGQWTFELLWNMRSSPAKGPAFISFEILNGHWPIFRRAYTKVYHIKAVPVSPKSRAYTLTSGQLVTSRGVSPGYPVDYRGSQRERALAAWHDPEKLKTAHTAVHLPFFLSRR